MSWLLRARRGRVASASLPSVETGLDRDSKAQAEQVRSIAVERLGDRLGVVPHAIMLDIDEALRLHLGL
jgi:mRNA interferase MazF